MASKLRWNRLAIDADSDAAFKRDFAAGIPRLVGSHFPSIELDLGSCVNIGEEAFKAMGPTLAEAAERKQVIVHVTDDLAKYFEGSGLSGLVDVNIVEHMEAVIKPPSGEVQSDLILPDDDALTDDTIPPDDDEFTSPTRIQTHASGGGIVDVEDGKVYPINDELLVGREPPCDPVYAIPTISKRHFRVYRQGPGYFIEDLQSTNGTYLNGIPLTQPQPLGENDEIVVAITLKHPEGARRFKFVVN
jgi:hypothetical protein